jgi:DNA modification methylase
LFVGERAPLSTDSNKGKIDREAIEIALGIVAAETWPSRYKSHKYWGRKPANVVAQYIEFFSDPGDVILDPFSGSGVTVVEGARLQRSTIGYDLNPFAVSLARAMLTPPSPTAFQSAAHHVIETVERAISHLYTTRCDACEQPATVRSIGYCGDQMKEVRYRCSRCRHSASRAPTSEDFALAAERVLIPEGAPDADILFGWEMQKLKRRGVTRWSDLFTHRNFVSAAHLRQAILAIDDSECRDWLMLSLTASLAQFTKMIADFSGDAGGPSWKINCYWMPNKWQELNPIWYFENRINKSIEAGRDLIANGAPFTLGKVEKIDSRHMPLADESVDYIFTDPPYGGEGIQYGELSLLWCLWLSEQQDLQSEIAFNPHRKLDQEHYAQGLRSVFLECFRVLKPGKWMTVTFANKDPVVWDGLMSACRSAGFTLVTAAPMKRSAPSLTETTMHTAPKADLVLSFEKPRAPKELTARSECIAEYSLVSAVRRILDALTSASKETTVHDVFDRVTVDWFSWFYENGDRPNAVQPTLSNVEAALRSLGISSATATKPDHESGRARRKAATTSRPNLNAR